MSRPRRGLAALRLPLPLHLALHALVLALLVTWGLAPERPTALFRATAVGAWLLACAPLLVPAWRARWRAQLARALHVADFAAFQGACLLLLVEGGLRVAARMNDSPLLAPPDADAEQRLRSARCRPGDVRHGFTLNERGLHDLPVAAERAPGVRRIVALGDSFAFGLVPYPENVFTLLDELLDAGGETEVVNYGVPAIGPGDELHLWRTEARTLEPDEVVLLLYVGNDVRDARGASLLHRDSLLAFAVVDRLLALHGEPLAQAREADGRPHLTHEAFLALQARQLDVCADPPDAETEQAYRTTERVLDAFAREIGPRLRVVLAPDTSQVDDALWAELAAGREDALDRGLPQRRLAAFLAARGVPCLDLLPALRQAQREGPVHLADDTHWNARGNAAAARAMAAWLPALSPPDGRRTRPRP